MTYMTITSPRLRRRYGKRQTALSGGVFSVADMLANAFDTSDKEIAACLASANATVADLDARVNDLAKNWNPTGFYTPAQVNEIVNNAMAVISNARGAVSKAGSQAGLAPSAITQLKQSQDDMDRAQQRSLDYLGAATAAQKSGSTVDAPGLKTWVTNTLNAASSAFVTAHVVSCELPWWVSVAASFLGVLVTVINALKKIVGVAVSAGVGLVKVAADAAESLPMIWTIVKWGGLAALGVFAVWKLKEYRRSHGL
jgi:hypothetical protein